MADHLYYVYAVVPANIAIVVALPLSKVRRFMADLPFAAIYAFPAVNTKSTAIDDGDTARFLERPEPAGRAVHQDQRQADHDR